MHNSSDDGSAKGLDNGDPIPPPPVKTDDSGVNVSANEARSVGSKSFPRQDERERDFCIASYCDALTSCWIACCIGCCAETCTSCAA